MTREHDAGAKAGLWAGAASADLTPADSVFLFGYPHVPRWSTGVHDRLESSALYLRQDGRDHLMIANDLIFVGRATSEHVRQRIAAETGVAADRITLTATHTHSGPITVDHLSNANDPVVPKVDQHYVDWAARQMIDAGCRAVRSAVPAEAAFAVARAEGVGTNRHDPAGPADPDVPVLLVRRRGAEKPLACMLAYAMHTTVLHEDSTLISGDFPHFTRRYLIQSGIVPEGCPIVYHQGASGNQSPRHVTRANTFAEAQRLGELLGRAVEVAVADAKYRQDVPIAIERTTLALRVRDFGSVQEAQRRADAAKHRFESLRAGQAPRTAVRTAECDWFGAEETVALSRAAADGRLAAVAQSALPAEIQVARIGPWRLVYWPGEFFVEYALEVKAQARDTFVVTMANGELQGYIVTPAAAERGVYEATNAVFAPENGAKVVQATLPLLARLG